MKTFQFLHNNNNNNKNNNNNNNNNNNKTGFGHVRTANVLGLSGAYETFLYEESLTAYSTSHPRYFTVQSAAEGKAVVVTLAWTDPAGMSDCGSDWSTSECLIHDVSFRPLAGFFVAYVP